MISEYEKHITNLQEMWEDNAGSLTPMMVADYMQEQGMLAIPIEPPVMQKIAGISKLLEDCGHKLNLYRLNVSGEHIGGVEHSELIKRIAEMLELLTKSNFTA